MAYADVDYARLWPLRSSVIETVASVVPRSGCIGFVHPEVPTTVDDLGRLQQADGNAAADRAR